MGREGGTESPEDIPDSVWVGVWCMVSEKIAAKGRLSQVTSMTGVAGRNGAGKESSEGLPTHLGIVLEDHGGVVHDALIRHSETQEQRARARAAPPLVFAAALHSAEKARGKHNPGLSETRLR